MEPPTIADHADVWLQLQQTRLQPATWHEYAGIMRRYLVPHLGPRPLTEVTHHDLTALYTRLLTSGGLRGKPLALVTVQRSSAVVHKFFADAVRMDLIPSNPADKSLLPRLDLDHDVRELRVWTAEQLSTFLEQQRHRPLWALWVVAAGTGMRRGELLGLRWSDVDFATATIHVRRALSVVAGTVRLKLPKTKQARSLRVGPTVVAALEYRRELQQREAAARNGHTGAPETARWNLVFTEPDGGHINPQKATDTWRESVRDSGLPLIRLHDVRHSHASLLLQAGVSPQVVSSRLGHSSITTTLDIYAEVLPAMDADAAVLFEQHVFTTPLTVPSGTVVYHAPAGRRPRDRADDR